MIVTRTAKIVEGKMVYDPPYTEAELAQQRELFSEMCRLRQPPGTSGSDRAFMNDEDVRYNGLQHISSEAHRQALLREARLAGINTTGKVYKESLADGLGVRNPLAWVSDRHDVKKACEIQNLNCTGIHQGHIPDSVYQSMDSGLAPDIVDDEIRERCVKDPTLPAKLKDKKKLTELREQIVHEHGASVPKRYKFKPSKRCIEAPSEPE